MATLKALVDETTNIKNELVTCHTNFKNILPTKGVTVNPSDKMSNLIDKVGTIELGKKWAEGTYGSIVSTKSTTYIKIRFSYNLSFTPSRIVVKFRYIKLDTMYHGENVNIDSKYSYNDATKTAIGYTYTSGHFYIDNISSSGFDINVKAGGASNLTVSSYNTDINWTAYE